VLTTRAFVFIRQAEFDIQRAVFEQRLHDAGISSVYEQVCDASEAAVAADDAGSAMVVDEPAVTGADKLTGKPLHRAAPFKHELKFEDLVYPPV